MKRKLLSLLLIVALVFASALTVSACKKTADTDNTGRIGENISDENSESSDASAAVTQSESDSDHSGSDGGYSDDEEGTEGLQYSLLSDGTYAVSVGTAQKASKIVIPSKYHGGAVTQILRYGFYECRELVEIDIPDTVTVIGDFAFSRCSGLTSVKIPEGVTEINNSTFIGCSGLVSVTIPDGVTVIGDAAFDNCGSLTSVIIPDGVTSIGDFTFANCKKLTDMIIPDGVTGIGDAAFKGCVNLENITIPNSVTVIGDNAFCNCENLNGITLPDGLTSIGMNAFENCDNITSAILPDTLTKIGQYAFGSCLRLKSVYYKGSEDDWARITESYPVLYHETELYFYSAEKPSTRGNFWRYEGDRPAVWEECLFDGTIYNVTVWVPDDAIGLTEKQIADFNASDYAIENGVYVKATVEGKSAYDAAALDIALLSSNPNIAPDILTFSQDQFSRLISFGALSRLGTEDTAAVRAANDAGSVKAATESFNEVMYAYPMASDNGYFMYYDKSVIPEEHIGSLEDIIADCEKAGKFISFDLENSAWYTASFFFGTGCVSEWQIDDDGRFVGLVDTFNSDEGLIAAKGMYKLLKSPSYRISSSAYDYAYDFEYGSAVVISGTWSYALAEAILGENLGCAKLPSFTVDGKNYQLGSFNQCKLMGVKRQTDTDRAEVLHKLAIFLTDHDRQVERYNELGWLPSDTEAQKTDFVQSNPASSSLLEQNAYSVPQGLIHGSWWDIGRTLATDINNSDGSDEGLRAALKNYDDALKKLFSRNF